MKRLITFTAALALVAGSVPALAQDAPEPVVPGQEFMLMWDLDSDGQVTLDEAREHRSDIFTMFDEDENGSFSPEELKGIDEFKLAQLDAGMGPGHQMPEGMQPGQGMRAQGMAPPQGQQMQPRRGMGQGMQPQGRGMGPGQGQGRGQGMMAQQQGRGPQGMGPQGRGMQGQGPQGQPMRGQGMGPGSAMQGSGFFAAAEDEMMRFDRNRDAKVTKLEFVDGTKDWFAMRDMNGDGVITPDDFGPRR
ncbi:EF hand domain-containing protein [Rhodobacter aestuarii]|uniref:EF hand n=1 Tax=Rhodobacter aestuarii TaxID=453582 RepID=A0A1N7NDZ2_9RHOB|nr:hypothetical protein [Rhodobacter aestuarii]PTV96400.1 EF hand domain-containing protein [Rhodobacter aestuarii]SIS96498.1 EF hand [Rhodobacter aestuarii]